MGAAAEVAALYMGNIHATEGDDDGALEYYQLCLTANANNVEAQRRVRLHHMRQRKKEGLFDRLFSKSTKTKKKSR